jgi:NDP-sugar pyrophosphorylase family protein
MIGGNNIVCDNAVIRGNVMIGGNNIVCDNTEIWNNYERK